MTDARNPSLDASDGSNTKQGSPAWFKSRLAKLTASRFGDVMARKGTKRYDDYQAELVLELSGAPSFEDDAPWFKHGTEHEPEARGAYEFESDNEVTETGFVIHPNIPYVGCSTDGSVEDTTDPKSAYGNLEIKCRSSLGAHHKSIKAGIDSVYKPQVQGCMWIIGREWCDFVSFYVPPDRFKGQTTDLHIHRVYRDESYIARLETRCEEFWAEVQIKLEDRNNGR